MKRSYDNRNESEIRTVYVPRRSSSDVTVQVRPEADIATAPAGNAAENRVPIPLSMPYTPPKQVTVKKVRKSAEPKPVRMWIGNRWVCKCGKLNTGAACEKCGQTAPKKPQAGFQAEKKAAGNAPVAPASAVRIRAYVEADLPEMIAIWNEIVAEGIAFPQEELLDAETGAAFFAQQTYTAVTEEDGKIYGLYILHPNNVGRCGHICNASYAVRSDARGKHIGEKLVLDCLRAGKENGFRVLQFNAVVESNIHARHLYERLGFIQLGTIKGGFRMKNGKYVNICPYYKTL